MLAPLHVGDRLPWKLNRDGEPQWLTVIEVVSDVSYMVRYADRGEDRSRGDIDRRAACIDRRNDDFPCVGGSLLRMTAPAPNTIVCDVGALVASDARTIDLLARLQLTAIRLGYRLLLSHASADLQELIGFSGLDKVLRVAPVGKSEGQGAP